MNIKREREKKRRKKKGEGGEGGGMNWSYGIDRWLEI